jgi:hypothetical protein
MKFTSKNYKIFKPQKYIEKNSLFLIVTGCDLNSINWVKFKQTLKNLNFNSYKIINRVVLKILIHSIYYESKPLVYGVTLFIKPQSVFSTLEKNMFLKLNESNSFNILALKLNNKMYSIINIKKLHSLTYLNNKLMLYKFILANLKAYHSFRFTSNSKQFSK